MSRFHPANIRKVQEAIHRELQRRVAQKVAREAVEEQGVGE